MSDGAPVFPPQPLIPKGLKAINDIQILYFSFVEPGKPTNVRFVEVNYQYVELEWDAPLNPNGRISRYRVHYRLNDTTDPDNAEKNPWVPVALSTYNPRSARVNGLVFNRFYEFKIEATNSIDWGEPALEVVLVTSVRSKYCFTKIMDVKIIVHEFGVFLL